MLYLLAEESLPEGMSDVIFWPFLLTLCACAIFYAGWWVENRLTKAPWKWVALAPIAAGLYIGWGYLHRWLTDSIYVAAMQPLGEKKILVAHWGSFFLPLLGLVAIILFHFFNHKLNLPTDDD